MGLGSEFVYGVAAGMAPTVLFLFASKQHWAMVLIASVAWLAVTLFASELRSKEQKEQHDQAVASELERQRRHAEERSILAAERRTQIDRAVKEGIRKHEMELARSKGNYIRMD